MIPYLAQLNGGIKYHYLSQPIIQMAESRLQGDSLCAFCARFKRGLLYSCCRENNYNKLILAQHLDDLAESFFMSALHNGQLRTMKANYKVEQGDISVIRPFAYVRESATREFALAARLPIINENCPACFEQPKERARVKRLLAQEESMVPALFTNMRRALLPLMHDDIYVTMEGITRSLEEANTGKPMEDSKKRAILSTNSIKKEKKGKEEEEEAKEERPCGDDDFDEEYENEGLGGGGSSSCVIGSGIPCYELA